MSRYVQYGCGRTAPSAWMNFDASPSLIIQKIPILGWLLRPKMDIIFPSNVMYGDIVKGLPIAPGSCDGIFCSHVLEHLTLSDFRIALRHTYTMLRDGGVFRCIVPDLGHAARVYVMDMEQGDSSASLRFLEGTMLGKHGRGRGLKAFAQIFYGNSQHLWMWDELSLTEELRKAGFRQIRPCHFHDAEDPMFKACEESGRFVDAISLECRK